MTVQEKTESRSRPQTRTRRAGPGKAKISINGYFKDLGGWFSLLRKRAAWINTGNPHWALDTTDPIADLAAHLHPGLLRTRIAELRQETPSTRTFRLVLAPEEAEAGRRLPAFHAGQYLSVKFLIEGRATSRPFAISSGPAEALGEKVGLGGMSPAEEAGFVEITLKRKPGGYVSEYVWEHWEKGSELLLDAPFGTTYYNGIRDAAHVIGLAGGSGVTIFRSIIKDMLQRGQRPERLTLLFGSRCAADILYRAELDRLAAASKGRVRIVHVLSEPEEGWQGETGFLSAELIARLVPDYAEASFYVSGPAALYDYIVPELDRLAIPPTRRRLEAYGESSCIEQHPGFPGMPGMTYKLAVRFGRDEQLVAARSTETVAVALERAGLAADTRCRSGECGWCRSLLEDGEVWQRPESDGVRARDRDVGYFHPCSAYPLGNLAVRVFTRL
ncbi:MAG: 2Fe-2S iron-sulfur cluster binding domain-containing protein [Coriobacteriales bacterium]|jgi:ferredoxin-NADP reductase|nr:2Fe-2S iron-sulfur cluster binding domain-containing protein [Coriobacteriales bacterium]